MLERPTEWPSREPIVSYHDFAYQAQSWHLPRRVVAKVEWHQGELFPRVGFIWRMVMEKRTPISRQTATRAWV